MQTSNSAQCAAKRRTGASFSGSVLLQRSSLRRRAIFLTVAGLLFLAAETAWAFETVRPQAAGGQDPASSQNLTTSSPPVHAGDPCLPLLRALPIDMNASAMDRNRRSAGDSAGVGLVFGIRFALGSGDTKRHGHRDNAPRLDIWQPGVTGNPHALAVADYNRCKGDQALKVLTDDWRWSR